MRIVAGAWRGRALLAPRGEATRPTADRVRQALFDMLLHAPWGGRGVIDGARVLDAFAGTGALGLEALSRGAASATFIEQDRAALAALRANIANLGAAERCVVLATNALAAPQGTPCSLVFLDPPYGQGLVPRTLEHLTRRGWIADGALIIAETGRDEPLPIAGLLAERGHGAARLSIWQAATTPRFIVHRHAVLGSTMDEARSLALAGAPDGTVVVARRQTAGRGRQGRAWFSPEGNLHASILLRPGLPAARLTELGFVVSLAVADAVDALLPGGRARLKWPNDVLVDGAKIAGILVELIDDGAAIVGIGVNLAHLPEAPLYPVTSLASLGAAVDVDEVLARLLAALETRLADWDRGGFAPVRAAWLARGPAPGATVRVRLGQQIINGRFAGLDADGALLIEGQGGTRRISAGEVMLSAP